MSNIVTKSALTRQFDQYATTVLGEFLTSLPHERLKPIIPRPGAFRPSPKSPIRHPSDTQKSAIVVKVNVWKAIGPFPVVGVAHQLAKEPGLFSHRKPNVFNWI